jgi:hypothetical protein
MGNVESAQEVFGLAPKFFANEELMRRQSGEHGRIAATPWRWHDGIAAAKTAEASEPFLRGRRFVFRVMRVDDLLRQIQHEDSGTKAACRGA